MGVAGNGGSAIESCILLLYSMGIQGPHRLDGTAWSIVGLSGRFSYRSHGQWQHTGCTWTLEDRGSPIAFVAFCATAREAAGFFIPFKVSPEISLQMGTGPKWRWFSNEKP